MRTFSIASMASFLILAILSLGAINLASPLPQSSDYSLRFYGYGFNDVGRVKIPIHPDRPADVGGDFTIEFWMKANILDNTSSTCTQGNDTWINGNIIIDRDLFGNVSFGDYGISLYGNSIAFGVNNGTTGWTICGGNSIADDTWRHIAVTRRQSDGQMQIFVDGVLVEQGTGPTGDISYDDNRAISNLCGDGSQPCLNEPFIVIGAEKHDYDPVTYPPYAGYFDELRISNLIRYTGNFTRPSAPFVVDANTVALYHFDEGTGNHIADSSGNNNTATRFYGGVPNPGPDWSTDTPFNIPILPTNTPIGYWLYNLPHNDLLHYLRLEANPHLDYIVIGLGNSSMTIYTLWNGIIAQTPIHVISSGHIVTFQQSPSTLIGGGALTVEHQTYLQNTITVDLARAFTRLVRERYGVSRNLDDVYITPQGITIGVSGF